MILLISVLLNLSIQAQSLENDLAAAIADLSQTEQKLELAISDPNSNPCDVNVLKIHREYSEWFVANEKMLADIVTQIQSQYQEARNNVFRNQDLQFQLSAQNGQTASQAKGSLNKVLAFVRDANRRLSSQKNIELTKVVRKQLDDFSLNPTKISVQQMKKIIELYNLELARNPNSKGNVSQITLVEGDNFGLNFSFYIDFDSFSGLVDFKGQEFAPGFQLKTEIRIDTTAEQQIDVEKLAYDYKIRLLKTPLSATFRFADILFKNLPTSICGSYKQDIVPLNSMAFYVPISKLEPAKDASVISQVQINNAVEVSGFQAFKMLDDSGNMRTIRFKNSGVQASGDVLGYNNDYDRNLWLAHCLKVRLTNQQDQLYAVFSPLSSAWQCLRNPYADLPEGPFKVEGIGSDRVYIIIPNGVGTIEYMFKKQVLTVSFLSGEHRKACSNPKHVFFSRPMVTGNTVKVE